jgi:putative glutamine amidotransferase
MRPLIGVSGATALATWSFWRQEAVLSAQTYLDAVTRAGGQPVILPPSPDADENQLLAVVDGILLVGGSDVSPGFYGEASTRHTEAPQPVRDLFELRLAAAAMDQDIPVLGICRGMQVMNVATGGTLHQDLFDAGFDQHRPLPGRLDPTTNHTIEVEVDSLLGRSSAAGVREVNSHHHQGAATIGDGGRITARSVPDGVVEAIEWPERRFALGVQWHPEDPPMDDIFSAFVTAASLLQSTSPARSA